MSDMFNQILIYLKKLEILNFLASEKGLGRFFEIGPVDFLGLLRYVSWDLETIIISHQTFVINLFKFPCIYARMTAL